MSYSILCPADMYSHDELIAYARSAEAAGLDTIWLPELYGRDPFVTCAVVLGATSTIRVGTAIANVYARDARATKAAAYSLADGYGNRFELGLGLSNKVGNEPRGHTWLPPIQKMTDFIDRYDAADMMFQNSADVECIDALHFCRLCQGGSRDSGTHADDTHIRCRRFGVAQERHHPQMPVVSADVVASIA